jgi:hypothetical protein
MNKSKFLKSQFGISKDRTEIFISSSRDIFGSEFKKKDRIWLKSKIHVHLKTAYVFKTFHFVYFDPLNMLVHI